MNAEPFVDDDDSMPPTLEEEELLRWQWWERLRGYAIAAALGAIFGAAITATLMGAIR